MKGLISTLGAMAVGAAAVYFLKGKSGASTLTGSVGNLATNAQKVAQGVGGAAYGTVQQKVRQPDNPNPDDRTLKERVQTEVFRNPETSREHINVNVVNGIVELRGELPNQADINALIDQVKSIANVRDVVSYLHLPNTVAPNKESAIDASVS